jgi:2-dehydropantoate 2-reductase
MTDVEAMRTRGEPEANVESTAVDRPIVVAGAGSIGCFVGGLLASAGKPVALLARPGLIDEIEGNGLNVTSFEGARHAIAPRQLMLSGEGKILAEAGVVLVTVKSADTAEIAEMIARHAPGDVVIVSLQNGVGNVPLLRERLRGRKVLAGMVPFNVIASGAGRFHRATSGDIVIERDDADTASRLSVPGLRVRASSDIVGVQWGKLLVNLNNAINALSGLPLREQLAQRPWRLLFADQLAEGLAAVRAEGIKPVSSTAVPLSIAPHRSADQGRRSSRRRFASADGETDSFGVRLSVIFNGLDQKSLGRAVASNVNAHQRLPIAYVGNIFGKTCRTALSGRLGFLVYIIQKCCGNVTSLTASHH